MGRQKMSMQYNLLQYKTLKPALAKLPLLPQGLACKVISSEQMCTASQQSWEAQMEHWANSCKHVNTPTAQPEAPLWLLALPGLPPVCTYFWDCKGNRYTASNLCFLLSCWPNLIKTDSFRAAALWWQQSCRDHCVTSFEAPGLVLVFHILAINTPYWSPAAYRSISREISN